MRDKVNPVLFWGILCSILWLTASVSLANSPARASCIAISPENVPEEAKYLELLIPMPQDDPYYCEFNQAAGSQTALTQSAPIVSYCDEDNYISYSFHMENAVSQMELKGDGDEYHYYSYQFGSGAYADGLSHLEYIQQNFGTIKAALLDEDGNILAVSEAASIRAGRSGYLTPTIGYDCADGKLTASIYKGNTVKTIFLIGLVLLMQLALLGGRAIFTAAVETAVSLAFRIRPWSTVFIVNLISNLIFNVTLILLGIFTQIPYLVLVTAGEILVVAAEYSVYRRRLAAYSRVRLMSFSIIANLCSLLLGLVIGLK